jgi:hypothetical protein
MHILRSGVALAAISSLGATLIAPSALRAQSEQADRDLAPATRQFGTGLVDIPVAWVSPTSGDIWVQVSATQIPYNLATQPALDLAARWNSNLAIDTHWAGRFSLGIALYSQNPEWGAFGQVLLVKEQTGRPWPALAIGFRNLGPFQHEDRLLVGHDVTIDSSGHMEGVTASYARRFHTAPTVYGVTTKSFSVGRTGSASLSIGFGSGLFYDDGDLGTLYNDKGQLARGLFLGGRYGFHPSPNTAIDLVAENNGWDWNAGVVGSWRGLSLGIYGTELEEGSKSPAKGPLYTVYNYRKLAISFGYSGNLFDVARGTVLRSRVAELEREEGRLRTELAHREARIESLEAELRHAQAGELAEVAKRREQLEAQIQEEREAIRRAEERLKKLQEAQPERKVPNEQPDQGAAPPVAESGPSRTGTTHTTPQPRPRHE